MNDSSRKLWIERAFWVIAIIVFCFISYHDGVIHGRAQVLSMEAKGVFGVLNHIKHK